MATVTECTATTRSELALRALYTRVLELERCSLEREITLGAIREDRDRLSGLLVELTASHEAAENAVSHLGAEVAALRRSRAYRWGSAARRLMSRRSTPEG